MDQQFAIAGYTGTGCLMCAIDGTDIWQVDYFCNRQQVIGKTAAAYTALEGTTQQYYDKLVELAQDPGATDGRNAVRHDRYGGDHQGPFGPGKGAEGEWTSNRS